MISLFSRTNLFYYYIISLSLLGLLVCGKTIFDYRLVGSDYEQDYLAAHALMEKKSIYSELCSAKYMVPSLQQSETSILNSHPPAYILILFPLSYLKYESAFVVLGFLSLLSLIGCVIVTLNEIKFPVKWSWTFGAIILVHPSVLACLATGNLSLILSLNIILVWFSLRRNLNNIAGALLAIATSLKLFPGFLILVFLITGNFEALISFIVVFCVIFMLSSLTIGFDELLRYVFMVVPNNMDHYVSHAFNLSISGAIHRLIGNYNEWSPWLGRLAVMPLLSSILTIGLSIMVLLFASAVIIQTPSEDRKVDEVFAILLICMLLISPLTWIHIFPVLIVPLSLLLRDDLQYSKRGGLFAFMIIVILISIPEKFVAQHLIKYLHTFILPWYTNFLLLAPFWGLLLLFSIFLKRWLKTVTQL